MNDVNQIILDEVRLLQKDVKQLIIDVVGIKTRSTIFGAIGGLIFTILITVIPLIINIL